MSLGTILIVILVFMLVGTMPVWPYSRRWGYALSGAIGLALIVLLMQFLSGRI